MKRVCTRHSRQSTITVRKIANKYCKDKIFTVRYQNKKGEWLERTLYHGGFRLNKEALHIDNAQIMPKYYGMESTSLMKLAWKPINEDIVGAEDNQKMIHVRKLKDLKGKEAWEKLMIARTKKNNRSLQML